MELLAFTHDSSMQDDEPDWGSVDKTKLPRIAFADQGTELKSTWKYPHHWIKDGGGEDENGVYTTGTMYLHRGGWQAAISAAHGARSGQQASQEVINHLEHHRSAVESYREQHASYIPETAQCWSNHMGLWCIEPFWMEQAIRSIRSGIWLARDMRETSRKESRTYELYEDIAILNLHGPMMKFESKFGGTSTVQIRQQIRQALRDDAVQTILLHIDSPGGHVAGTQELADDIFKIRQTGKRAIAHIEDLGASAAYWCASQCQSITANRTAEVGSIGTVAILEDNSARMNRLGVKVHVVATGQYKGVGVEGAAISDDDLAYIRSRVEGLNEHFQASLRRGRPLSQQQLANVSDGKVYLASQARKLGLVDHIMSFEDVLKKEISGGKNRSELKSLQHEKHALRAFRQRYGV